MRIVPILILLFATLSAGSSPARAEEDESRFIRNARQLTFEGRRAGEGYFSADGKFLVFQSEREPGNPFYQIYLLNFDTGDVARVSPGKGKTTCAWFCPDTERILFASTHLDPLAIRKQEEEYALRSSGKERRYAWDYDSTFDIFTAGYDGSEIQQLTQAEGYDAEASCSPDGKTIVFCSTRDAYPDGVAPDELRERRDLDASYFGEIYIMAADGESQTRLTEWPGYDGGPFFSPDGKRIVWRHFSEDGALADIYAMQIDGSDRRQITDFGSMCWAPYYHPSGKYIIFTTNKLGFSNFELYIVDTEGNGEPIRVTFTDGFDGLPVFSADGERISWTSNRTHDDKSQIFIGAWSHTDALDALDDAPERGTGDPGGTGHDGNKHGAREPDGNRPGAGTQRAAGTEEERLRVAGYTLRATKDENAAPMSAERLRESVAFLASDDLEGRMTGSDGERKAGDYIAERFSNIGLNPAGEDGFFQGFPFTSGVSVIADGCNLEVTSGGTSNGYEIERDFRPLAFSENGEVEGDVVFAGYGLTTPGDEESGYDSYAGLDVKDMIVLVLRWVPEDADQERRSQLNMYAGLRYKAMIARENGAKALLVAVGPNSPGAGEMVPIKFDHALAGSGIPVATVSGAVVEQLFAGHDQTLEEVQTGLDQENPHVLGAFALEGAHVKLSTSLNREKGTGRNVLAYLPPGDGNEKAPVIVIGAHYDHIGHGEVGSLAKKGEEGMIHNGADDNASGTSVVLALAEALAEEHRENPDLFQKGIVFAAWSGEEIGIIGSNYWMDNPTVDGERIAVYLNFDMVGRMRDNTLLLQGIGSSDVWKGLIEKRNVAAGFNVKLTDDPFLPMDVTAFYPNNVPVLAWFTGSHNDYNRPTDDAETLNYSDMERIAEFAFRIARDLAADTERPAWLEVERSSQETGARASLRAYLGTIPDYSTGDVEGVTLSGVRGGGPADKAGLQGGDVIVMFGGREIKNIYDYTYALDAVKIGEPVEVIVLRDGERVTLTVTPEARQ